MRVAAVDCGTNSIRLLVAEAPVGAGASTLLTDVVRRVEVVRLGYGVDATGVIAPESMERALAMTREYASECDRLGVEAVRFVTTSAARDARNADDFIAGVEQAFGGRDVRPEVLSGQEEAELSFLGATGGLAEAGAEAPYLVVDLGGGSTEFVLGDGDVPTRMLTATSTDMGCVRTTERYLRELHTHHASGGQSDGVGGVEAALEDIDAHLDRVEAELDFSGVGTLVGLAGTVTTVTAHTMQLPRYDSAAVHLARLDVGEVLAACDDLLASGRGRLAALPYMHPGRVDVIAAGALMWGRIVTRVAQASGIDTVLTSEHDILDGIARSLLREA
ncbi:MAG: exopolyphosphatase [Dermatophilus congolensis]|nr:exopolyphosphatase [Dermatophilus congolensis]